MRKIIIAERLRDGKVCIHLSGDATIKEIAEVFDQLKKDFDFAMRYDEVKIDYTQLSIERGVPKIIVEIVGKDTLGELHLYSLNEEIGLNQYYTLFIKDSWNTGCKKINRVMNYLYSYFEDEENETKERIYSYFNDNIYLELPTRGEKQEIIERILQVAKKENKDILNLEHEGIEADVRDLNDYKVDLEVEYKIWFLESNARETKKTVKIYITGAGFAYIEGESISEVR